MYRGSCCTTSGVDMGIGVGGIKMLKFYCTTSGIGGGIGVVESKLLKFFMKDFYVMGIRHC